MFKHVTMDGKALVVNDEHKLLFEVGSETAIPSTCPEQGVLLHTNFKKLYLYQGDMRNEVVPLITPRGNRLRVRGEGHRLLYGVLGADAVLGEPSRLAERDV